MGQITLKDIIFSNVPDKKLGTKIGNKLTQTNATSNVQEYIESANFYKLINAVDIDWNGIQIDENIIINDTADLIKWIANAAGQAGADGVTPHIGANGNWFIGETDTEVKAQGPAGETGAAGAAGANGANGKSAYELYRETVVEKEAQPAIYSFESFNNEAKEVKYGEGKVKVIEMRAGGATVEVTENTAVDPNAEDFVGQQFNVATGLATDAPIQLYTLANEPVDIWVTVELVSDAQEAVVAMTQSEWLDSLKGADGKDGAQGPKGDTGTFDASALEDYATKTFVDEKIGDLGNATEATEAQGEEGQDGYVPAQPAVAHTVKTYVDKKISDLINGADSAYDTLKEIADKLDNNDDVVGALTTQIASKANASDVYTKTEVDNKIGTLGNKSEAQDAVYSAVANGTTLTEGETYYTSNTGEGEFKATGEETANGTNYFVLTTPAVDAVPYTNVMDVIIDNEEVTAAAFADLQAKYEALLARVAAIEGTNA